MTRNDSRRDRQRAPFTTNRQKEAHVRASLTCITARFELSPTIRLARRDGVMPTRDACSRVFSSAVTRYRMRERSHPSAAIAQPAAPLAQAVRRCAWRLPRHRHRTTQAIIAASMDTQRATQAANRLLSISVSNLMAALRKLSERGFQERCCKADANRHDAAKTA